jgi:glycosyltransferase involved in cell wall biosynthesis
MPDSPAPGITVVVPTLNQGRFIDDAIRSVLDQNYPNVEIAVVDGGSTDDTIERLRRYGDRIAWSSEKDEGQAHAIEKGFAQARKEWLTWLNSDDVQCNGALSAVADAISRRPDAEIVFGKGHYIDEGGAFLRDYPTIALDRDSSAPRAMFESGYVAQPSVFFRKDAYRRIGGVDRTLDYVMDYELWIRFALAGAKFVAIERDISGNRWHQGAKTAANLMDLYAEAVAVQIRHYGKVSPYFVQAVSDHLFQKLQGARTPAARSLIWRWLYFKATWVLLNARRPGYCLRGLFAETLAKSGPIIGDRMRLWEWLRACAARDRHKPAE